MKHPLHVAVLLGGFSSEREVSLRSGAACADALERLGHRVTRIDVRPDIASVLGELKPDAVFNALHGRFGEDGCMQGILEILRIPYTHSGVLASALAMDKPMAKHLFAAAGLRTPTGKILKVSELTNSDPLPRPYVIKPANEGSSVGVHLFGEKQNSSPCDIIKSGSSQTQIWLAEEYIAGRELTVAVLDGRSLAVTELRPHSGFYDYTNKYTDGKTEHLVPAPVTNEIYEAALHMALTAHKALGCRGLTRSDFRYDERQPGAQGLYILEVNTQPGMTSLSLAPEQAAQVGIDFTTLVGLILESARLGA